MDKQLFLFLFLLNIVKNNCIETNCSLMIAGYLPGIGGLAKVDLTSGASTKFSAASFIPISFALTSDLSTGQLFFGDVSSISHAYRVNLFESTSLTIIRSYEDIFVTEMIAETNLHVIFMTIQAEHSSIIAKMSYDGTGYDEILFVDRNSAVSMAVDQQDRKLYFNELGGTRGISRSTYDGSDVEVFLEIHFPFALSADSHGRKLYFAQTYTLHVINFNGTDQRQLHISLSHSFMSITYLDGLLYIAASYIRNDVFEETRIMTFQLNGPKTLSKIATYYNESLIYGIAVHCPLRLVQTNLSDGLTSTVRNEVASTVTSSIPTEPIPVRSVTECSLVLAGASLSPSGLAKVDLATQETNSLAASLNIRLGYAVTSDQNTGQLFFNDVYTNGRIYSYNLLRSAGLTPLRSFDNGLYATGMIADTDIMVLFMVIPRENSSFIAKINYNGTGYQEIISQETTSTSVALDQRDRKVYYNNLGDRQILRANYDGSNVEEFLTTDLNVLHMATDAAGGKLYFSQIVLLEVINFNGSGRQQIHYFESLHLNAMTYLNGFIYFGATYMPNDGPYEKRLMSLKLDGSSALRVIETYSNDATINGMAPFCRSIALQTTTTYEPRSTTDQSENNGLTRETVIIIATVVSGGVFLAVVVVVIICCCRKRKYLADGDAYDARGKNTSRPANKRIKIKDSYLSPLSNRDHQLGNFNHGQRTGYGNRPYLPNTSDGIIHANGQYLTTNANNKQHQRNTKDIRHQYLNPRQTNYQASNSHMNRGSSIDTGYSGSDTYYLHQPDTKSYASYDNARPNGMESMYSTGSNAYDKIPYEY